MISSRLNIPLFFMVIVAFALFPGCIADQCGGVVCSNDGVCVRGACVCTFGYEGDFCSGQWQDKFAGKWRAGETDKNGNILREYEVTISTAGYPDTFFLHNLAGTIQSVTCYREAYRTFTMVAKDLADGVKLQSGQGTLAEDGSSVTGLYVLNKNDITTTVSYNWTR